MELPNFTGISGVDKRYINNSRLKMLFMLKPCNRIQALVDFVRLAIKAVRKHECVQLKDKEKEEEEHFFERYKTQFDASAYLFEYTRQSFFYKTLNRGLKALSDGGIEEMGYLRRPFSDIFYSIR